MSVSNKNLVINMLNELQNISIDDPAAERLALGITSLNETFRPLEKEPFFDTEPAHFDRALSQLAKGPGGKHDG